MTAPGGGRIGMVACPGLQRGLEADLEGLKQWGANGLVSLVEAHELITLGITDLEATLDRHGLWWRHLPIKDRHTPDEGFEKRWHSEGTRLRRLLSAGDRFCGALLGRSGTNRHDRRPFVDRDGLQAGRCNSKGARSATGSNRNRKAGAVLAHLHANPSGLSATQCA